MDSPDGSPRYSRTDSEKGSRTRSRSRQRSQSRSRDRSRPRTRSRHRSRSISETYHHRNYASPPRGETEFVSLLNEQQEKVFDIISAQKEEIEELKEDSGISFRSKAIEKQFKQNQRIIKDLKKIKKALKKGRAASATDQVRSLLNVCEEHKEDLLIADSSKFGWLTVHQLRGKSSLSSDLLKKVDKIDSKLDKERTRPAQHGNWREKRTQKGGEVLERETRQFTRRKAGPEETLQFLKKSKRYGTCSHCQEEGHFFRECAKFWAEVSEQRKQNSSN